MDEEWEGELQTSFIKDVFYFGQWLFVKVLNLVLIDIPTFIIKLLSKNFEFNLHLSSLLLFIIGALIFGIIIIRYFYLTGYSKDNTGKKQKTSSIQQQPNIFVEKKPSKKPLNYLDEFLAAIKVFGYLDKSVFHELTKSMTTQKLAPDEILCLDETLGFSIVVEGTAQIYIKLPKDNAKKIEYEIDEERNEFLMLGDQQYQLLNEVKSGLPLSSLISTLELFKLRYPDILTPEREVSLNLDYNVDNNVDEDDDYPNIIVCPKKKRSGDTITIAIIPQSAFERVQNKYPKATSHIVTMVLTRLYKVTMNTVHNYLGLTNELMKSETKLNEQTPTNLPRYLVDGLLEKLNENENPKKKKQKQHHRLPLIRSSSRYVLLDSKLKSNHPGDLLSSVPISRNDKKKKFKDDEKRSNFTDEIEETEENSLRIAIIENIFKIVGISEPSHFSYENGFSSSSSANSSVVNLNNLQNLSKSSTPGGKRHNVFKHDNLMNTIQMSQLKKDPPIPRLSQNMKKKSLSDMNVKDAFAKTLEIKSIGPNTTLIEEGSLNNGLYYVIDGSLEVFHSSENNTTHQSYNKHVYTVQSGGIAGYLTSVVGFKSLTSIKTPKKQGAIVAYIAKNDYNKLLDKFYFLQLPVATKLKSLLSYQILIIDYALEWCHIPTGNVLCSQGDLANGFHVVLSGRFRVVRSVKNGDKEETEILGEYGHGQSVGEVEVLTASRRSNSLVAVRDSETARIPRTLFELLSFQNPSIMVKVSRLVASKVLSQEKSIQAPKKFVVSSGAETFVSADYKTITILPTVSELPVKEFANKLLQAFKIVGRNVIALDQASTLTHLGRHAFDESLARLKLSGYFAYLEEEYETIIYICDTPVQSNWTSTCISQGDCILLLADAQDENTATSVGEYEQLLIKLKTSARTDLCLIHQEKFVSPGSTNLWLKNRLWVQGHHHIQMYIERNNDSLPINKKSFINDLATKLSRNKSFISKFENSARNIPMINNLNVGWKNDNIIHNEDVTFKSHKNDFLRLARILSNEAVGLVLGGGGSRGISHVGVVTALERHGIPVDLIGGTSIGSFVGGLYAKDYNIVSIYGRAKKFSKRVASAWRMIFDLTYPVTSYITGYEFNRGIWKVFGFTEIEDFWIKYYCNSTNITNSTMDIHETGVAWRFIRASMSLAGLLPPIAYKGCMLLDGGYLDNLPVMEMKRRGVKHIIAVDVGSADERTAMNYGDTLSGFWVLFNRWNPFSKHPDIPNMMDIQMRLAYVASVNALEEAKRTPGVYYLRPPIENYATLDFGKFDEIYQVGLGYADKLFTEWENTKKLPPIAGFVDKENIRNGHERKHIYRRNSI
ncbi:unnamed protein product [Candida verbasci]|uniref:Lysophospholipase NTE1 n=1 Tax=Candida verbasci TaxID=1227364 RepID=A0A9W4TSP4_9ASCO|nr:unnamed protein product [Candida verbasci]